MMGVMDYDSLLRPALVNGIERHNIVGASVAVVARDGIEWEFHCGFADRERGMAPDARTIWDWGSVTKLLCGILVMQQRDRGRLRLDEPAAKYLPILKKCINPYGTTDAITLEHVLTHTSGLQCASYPDPIPIGGIWPLWHDIEREFQRIQVEAPLGERYIYSNLGFMLLGRIVELVTRDEWESHATKNILMPLGMCESYFDQTPYHLRERRAESYDETGRALGIDVDHGATTSNGGLKASLADMARFARFLINPQSTPLLSRQSLHEMFRQRHVINAESEIGLAFHILKFQRRNLIGHNGAAAGFRAGVWLAPDVDAAVVFAANTATARPLLTEICRVFAENL